MGLEKHEFARLHRRGRCTIVGTMDRDDATQLIVGPHRETTCQSGQAGHKKKVFHDGVLAGEASSLSDLENCELFPYHAYQHACCFDSILLRLGD
mmetsp:Transcript_10994/g.22511  ORF Transcript_10994/g.22511 Transcript_10994/m.22511 type:complete len:95 (+) Transcript_10994:763-1047(+)